jgi:O-antigen/teichoic acid export membrane protein
MTHPLARLARGTLIYGVSGALSKLLVLLLLPVFTAYLTPAEYGAVTLLTLLYAALSAVFSCGLGVSIGICYFEDRDAARRNATIWTSFAVLLASVAVLFVITALCYRAAGEVLFGGRQYEGLLLAIVVAASASILSQPFALSLQFREEAAAFATVSVSAAIVGAVTSLYLVVVQRLGVTGIVIGTVTTQVLTFILFLSLAFRQVSRAFDATTAIRLIARGLPMIPSFLSLFVLLQGNQFVLKEVSGLDALGVYGVGFSLGMAMSLLVNAFATAWPPFFLSYWHNRKAAQQVFRQVFTYYVLGFGTIGLMFFVWARPVVMLMTAPEFLASHYVVGWSATAQLFSGIFSLLLPAVYYSQKVAVVSAIQGLAAMIAIGLALALIPKFGVQGAAYSLSLGFLAMCTLQYAWNRFSQKEFTMTYDSRRIGRFFTGYVIIGVVVSIQPPSTLSADIFQSAFASFIALLLVFFLLTGDERRAIVEWVKSIQQKSIAG